MSEEREYDVVCIGGGPAAEALAGQLNGTGISLAVIESHLVGGECPYWGCIPSKTMLRSAEVLAEAGRAQEIATSEISWKSDYPKVYSRVYEMARKEDDTKSAAALEKNGAKLIRGKGRLTGARTVEVDGHVLTARRAVVIASGTSPAIPPIDGVKEVEYWTNREAVLAAEQPERLVVIGAGAVGVELTQAFVRLGTHVHLVEPSRQPVPLEDPAAGAYLREALEREGVEVSCGSHVVGMAQHGREIAVTLGSGDVIRGDRVLLATGRWANIDGFDLAAAGVSQTERGWIKVDPATLQAADGVYAIGDVTGLGGFTHLADYHGNVIGRILKGEDARADHRAIPRVTFTDPEIASVGLSEAQAREQGINVRVVSVDDIFNGTARGYIHGVPGGMMKLVADGDRRHLVGATLCGPRSGELIGELCLAIRAEVPLTILADVVHGFPTFARTYQELFHRLNS
jgi:pyruvate/2-oxoglutarate dehydrogenase complex dihydrolipoamide dehydrogenase (E3) component